MLSREARRTFDAGEQSGHGTFRDQIEGGTAGHRASRTFTDNTLRRRQAESDGIHVQREFTGDSSAEHPLEPVQKKKKTFQKDWVKWQCSVDSQTQPILCLINKAMKARGAKEKFGQAPAGEQRARTPTDARRSLTQAGDNRGRQQSLTSWLRPKTPSTARKSAEDSRGGQRLLTSWMRPKSPPAPAVAPVVEYISPAPAVNHTASALVENYISPAPVVRYASPAPAVCAVPAPVVEYISPTPARKLCRASSRCGVHFYSSCRFMTHQLHWWST